MQWGADWQVASSEVLLIALSGELFALGTTGRELKIFERFHWVVKMDLLETEKDFLWEAVWGPLKAESEWRLALGLE